MRAMQRVTDFGKLFTEPFGSKLRCHVRNYVSQYKTPATGVPFTRLASRVSVL
jgi:hypothetical protein